MWMQLDQKCLDIYARKQDKNTKNLECTFPKRHSLSFHIAFIACHNYNRSKTCRHDARLFLRQKLARYAVARLLVIGPPPRLFFFFFFLKGRHTYLKGQTIKCYSSLWDLSAIYSFTRQKLDQLKKIIACIYYKPALYEVSQMYLVMYVCSLGKKRKRKWTRTELGEDLG